MFGLDDALGAVLSIGGNLLGGHLQQKAQQGYIDQAQDFSERMSSTAYQRAVNDMKLAGINPILASQVGGASSPSGVSGTAVNYVGDAVDKGISTAFQSQRQRSDISVQDVQKENIVQDSELKRESAFKTAADTAVARGQPAIQKKQGDLLDLQAAGQQQQNFNAALKNKLLGLSMSFAESESRKGEFLKHFWDSDWGRMMMWLDNTGRSINPFASAGNSAKSVLGGGQ